MPVKKPVKEKTEKKKAEEAPLKKAPQMDKYFEAVGRRKSASARVRLVIGDGDTFNVNDKKLEEYFKEKILQKTVHTPFAIAKDGQKFNVHVKVMGGGKSGQAGAIRHGISRALLVFNAEHRKRLKRAGFLKRDPRVKERRKFGLKKARKSPQWSKR